MLRPYESKSDDFELVFWGQRWIQNSISEYRKGNCKFASLKGRKVIFPAPEKGSKGKSFGNG